MKHSHRLHSTPLFALLAAAAVLCPQPGRGSSIGVDFGSAGNEVAPTDLAGVPGFAQTNWQAVTAVATNLALTDNTGAATTATLTTSTMSFMSFNAPTSGLDEVLNVGFAGSLAPTLTFTLNSIPYASYSLLVYDLSSLPTTHLGITAGGTTYYSSSPQPNGAGYIDGNASTPFTYTQATGTTSASATPLSDYMLFTGLSGASQMVSIARAAGAMGTASVGAFQIIETVPEPSTALLLAGSGAALLLRRRKAQQCAR